jgi:2',3'-cyclic-nucleotide 2'-phosphodiesterase (5'-nucleotidase family)
VALDSRNVLVRAHEATIGNLIADAMLARTRADVAIMNGGGIRGGKTYEPGTMLTRRDIQAELPFGNHLVVLDIKGAALCEAIENGLSRLPAPAGRFPQVSGITVEYDSRRPAGSRVLSIKVGDAPLDPDKTYRLATNNFMARGGDGYASFAAVEPLVPLDDSPLLANEVIVYLSEIGTVRSVVDGRLSAK